MEVRLEREHGASDLRHVIISRIVCTVSKMRTHARNPIGCWADWPLGNEKDVHGMKQSTPVDPTNCYL